MSARDGCDACGGRTSPLLHALIPPFRAYMRFWPWRAGKRALWEGFVGPRLSRHAHSFAARTIYGTKLKGNQRWIMHRCIYYFGLWEPPLSRWIRDALEPGDTFVDVGANFGYFSLLAAATVGGTGRVVALEPAPATFTRLEANLALNSFENIRREQVAASAAERALSFYRAPNDAESSTAPLPGLTQEGEVRGAPLASLLSGEDLDGTRVVKIDVEGAELDVLEGLVPVLDRLRRDAEIAVEVHPHLLAHQNRSVSDILELLEPHGFVAYWLPVDFSPLAHLEPASLRPRRLTAPPDELVHMIFSRRRAAEL